MAHDSCRAMCKIKKQFIALDESKNGIFFEFELWWKMSVKEVPDNVICGVP